MKRRFFFPLSNGFPDYFLSKVLIFFYGTLPKNEAMQISEKNFHVFQILLANNTTNKNIGSRKWSWKFVKDSILAIQTDVKKEERFFIYGNHGTENLYVWKMSIIPAKT